MNLQLRAAQSDWAVVFAWFYSQWPTFGSVCDSISCIWV